MNRKPKNQAADETFLLICSLLVIAAGWNRFKHVLWRFLVEHRFLVAFVVSAAVFWGYLKLKRKFIRWRAPADAENDILLEPTDEDSVFAGVSSTTKKRVFVRQSYRRMHAQVIGTTNAGKTESVILPWAIDDIKKGRGLLIIDGKSDRSLLDKLYAYAFRFHRADDVRILSLCDGEMSHTFNPLAGGPALEIAERVFKALTFENEYFKSIQYEALLQVLLLFEKSKIVPTPLRIVEALQSPVALKSLAANVTEGAESKWARGFLSLTHEEREQRTSGLVAQLQAFAVGDMAAIFNCDRSDIDLSEAMSEGRIIYCQLPVLKIPTLGKATGKLILQALQSAVASRHLGISKEKGFFSVYLDDFTEYLTEGFVSLLNKSRSANVAIVFAHQALGDLAALGEGVKNTILTNANLKVFMRTNEPESAEYFASVIGTTEATKVTERQRKSLVGTERTGEGSVRDVEEFRFHPNLFKQQLGVGEAVMVLPHAKGSFPVRLKFRRSPDLDPVSIPKIQKSAPVGLEALFQKDPQESTANSNAEIISTIIRHKSFDQKEAA